MMSKTYAILGGGGAFGIHTAEYLLRNAKPTKVIGIGRNPLRPEPFSLNIEDWVLPPYEYHARHITHELDLLLELLDKEKPEVIINYAAQGEGAVSWTHSWRFFETNSMALVRLTEELSHRDWLEHFIQIGTSEMYGSVDHAVTEDEPIKPTSPYAASKVAFDMYLLSMHEFKSFPMTILRPSNCYCPGQLLHRVIPRAFLCGFTGKKLPLHGGGKAEKSFLHVRDLAEAIYLASDVEPTGQVYNVGPNKPTSIHTVVSMCARAMNIGFDDLCEVVPDRLGQDSRYWLDSTKIHEELNWYQSVDWHTGLEEMAKWTDKYLGQIRDLNPEYILRA